MTEFLAIPPVRRLSGVLRVPASKSATNRALVAAALTGDAVDVVHPLESDDTAALIRCLEAMGAEIARTQGGLSVRGPLQGSPTSPVRLDAADSGTAARFLAAAASVVPGRWRLTGSPRLCERPIGELLDTLRSAGARIACTGRDGFLPLDIEGARLLSARLTVDASRSSQFFSALLLAALAVDDGFEVRAVGEVVSAPYVDMTVETLRALGHEVRKADGAIHVRRGARAASRHEVPGDYSSAVAILAAVAAAGGEVRLLGLLWPSSDADARALPVLEAMGLAIEASPGAIAASALAGGPRPIDARATDFPDAVPVLAAVAALASGVSRFEAVAHLRLKESDRLDALAELLTSAGARAEADRDTLRVSGPARAREGAARIATHRDHRIAMAAGVLALRVPGLLIENPGCVSKSYPQFFRDLERLAVR